MFNWSLMLVVHMKWKTDLPLEQQTTNLKHPPGHWVQTRDT